MEEKRCDKLLLAVMHGDDFDNVAGELNRNGFALTVLNSVGGFLRKRSVTVMIGLPGERVEEALEILKKEAKQRTETVYQSAMMPPVGMISAASSVPVQMSFGGVKVFVLDLERMESF